MCVDLSILSALILDQMSWHCTGSLLHQASTVSPPALCNDPHPSESSKRGHDLSAPAAASSCCPEPSAADGLHAGLEGTDEQARQPKRRAVQQQGGDCELHRAATACSERLSSQTGLGSRPGMLQASVGSAFQPYTALSARASDAQQGLLSGRGSLDMPKVHSTPSSSGWDILSREPARDPSRAGDSAAAAAPCRRDGLSQEQAVPEGTQLGLRPSESPGQTSRQTVRPLPQAFTAVQTAELQTPGAEGLRLPLPLGQPLQAAGQNSGHFSN